jgi:hypothetical protein
MLPGAGWLPCMSQDEEWTGRTRVGVPRKQEFPIIPYGFERGTRQFRYCEDYLALRCLKQATGGEVNIRDNAPTSGILRIVSCFGRDGL